MNKVSPGFDVNSGGLSSCTDVSELHNTISTVDSVKIYQSSRDERCALVDLNKRTINTDFLKTLRKKVGATECCNWLLLNTSTNKLRLDDPCVTKIKNDYTIVYQKIAENLKFDTNFPTSVFFSESLNNFLSEEFSGDYDIDVFCTDKAQELRQDKSKPALISSSKVKHNKGIFKKPRTLAEKRRMLQGEYRIIQKKKVEKEVSKVLINSGNALSMRVTRRNSDTAEDTSLSNTITKKIRKIAEKTNKSKVKESNEGVNESSSSGNAKKGKASKKKKKSKIIKKIVQANKKPYIAPLAKRLGEEMISSLENVSFPNSEVKCKGGMVVCVGLGRPLYEEQYNNLKLIESSDVEVSENWSKFACAAVQNQPGSKMPSITRIYTPLKCEILQKLLIDSDKSSKELDQGTEKTESVKDCADNNESCTQSTSCQENPDTHIKMNTSPALEKSVDICAIDDKSASPSIKSEVLKDLKKPTRRSTRRKSEVIAASEPEATDKGPEERKGVHNNPELSESKIENKEELKKNKESEEQVGTPDKNEINSKKFEHSNESEEESSDSSEVRHQINVKRVENELRRLNATFIRSTKDDIAEATRNVSEPGKSESPEGGSPKDKSRKLKRPYQLAREEATYHQTVLKCDDKMIFISPFGEKSKRERRLPPRFSNEEFVSEELLRTKSVISPRGHGQLKSTKEMQEAKTFETNKTQEITPNQPEETNPSEETNPPEETNPTEDPPKENQELVINQKEENSEFSCEDHCCMEENCPDDCPIKCSSCSSCADCEICVSNNSKLSHKIVDNLQKKAPSALMDSKLPDYSVKPCSVLVNKLKLPSNARFKVSNDIIQIIRDVVETREVTPDISCQIENVKSISAEEFHTNFSNSDGVNVLESPLSIRTNVKEISRNLVWPVKWYRILLSHGSFTHLVYFNDNGRAAITYGQILSSLLLNRLHKSARIVFPNMTRILSNSQKVEFGVYILPKIPNVVFVGPYCNTSTEANLEAYYDEQAVKEGGATKCLNLCLAKKVAFLNATETMNMIRSKERCRFILAQWSSCVGKNLNIHKLIPEKNEVVSNGKDITIPNYIMPEAQSPFDYLFLDPDFKKHPVSKGVPLSVLDAKSMLEKTQASRALSDAATSSSPGSSTRTTPSGTPTKEVAQATNDPLLEETIPLSIEDATYTDAIRLSFNPDLVNSTELTKTSVAPTKEIELKETVSDFPTRTLSSPPITSEKTIKEEIGSKKFQTIRVRSDLLASTPTDNSSQLVHETTNKRSIVNSEVAPAAKRFHGKLAPKEEPLPIIRVKKEELRQDFVPFAVLLCTTPNVGYIPIIRHCKGEFVLQDPRFTKKRRELKFNSPASAAEWLNMYFLNVNYPEIDHKWTIIKGTNTINKLQPFSYEKLLAQRKEKHALASQPDKKEEILTAGSSMIPLNINKLAEDTGKIKSSELVNEPVSEGLSNPCENERDKEKDKLSTMFVHKTTTSSTVTSTSAIQYLMSGSNTTVKASTDPGTTKPISAVVLQMPPSSVSDGTTKFEPLLTQSSGSSQEIYRFLQPGIQAKDIKGNDVHKILKVKSDQGVCNINGPLMYVNKGQLLQPIPSHLLQQMKNNATALKNVTPIRQNIIPRVVDKPIRPKVPPGYVLVNKNVSLIGNNVKPVLGNNVMVSNLRPISPGKIVTTSTITQNIQQRILQAVPAPFKVVAVEKVTGDSTAGEKPKLKLGPFVKLVSQPTEPKLVETKRHIPMTTANTPPIKKISIEKDDNSQIEITNVTKQRRPPIKKTSYCQALQMSVTKATGPTNSSISSTCASDENTIELSQTGDRSTKHLGKETAHNAERSNDGMMAIEDDEGDVKIVPISETIKNLEINGVKITPLQEGRFTKLSEIVANKADKEQKSNQSSDAVELNRASEIVQTKLESKGAVPQTLESSNTIEKVEEKVGTIVEENHSIRKKTKKKKKDKFKKFLSLLKSAKRKRKNAEPLVLELGEKKRKIEDTSESSGFSSDD